MIYADGDRKLEIVTHPRHHGWMSSVRRWKPLSFRDVDQVLRISEFRLSELRLSDDTTESSTETPVIVSSPPVARRRKSLADLLTTFKAKLARDRSSSEASHPTEPSSIEKVVSFSTLSSQGVADIPNWVPVCDPPPRLEVLAELPQQHLQRTSTFRDTLEKAAVDINNRYGTVQSLPDSAKLRRRPSLHNSRLNDKQFVPIPPRSYFRPQDRPNYLVPVLRNPIGPALSGVSSTPSCVSRSCCRHSMANRVPLSFVEKVLEESLPLRASMGIVN